MLRTAVLARVCDALPTGFEFLGSGAKDLQQGSPTAAYPSRRLKTRRQRVADARQHSGA